MKNKIMGIAALLSLAVSGSAFAGYDQKADCADRQLPQYNAHQCNGTALHDAYTHTMIQICMMENGLTQPVPKPEAGKA